LTYVNAGHNPPLIYNSLRNELAALHITGIPLGIDDGMNCGQQGVQLNLGDFVLLYTDGVTEAIALQGQEFGIERLQAALLALRDASADGTIAGVLQSVKKHTHNAALSDDITMIVAKRNSHFSATSVG